MYRSWDMNLNRKKYFAILHHFLPLTPLTAWKMKRSHGDIIILHKCTKNNDHPLYCSWDAARDKRNCYFHFGLYFPPFTPLTAQKMKTSKQWKQSLDISSFYTTVPKIMIRCYTIPEILRVSDVIAIVHFGQFLALLPL